MAQAVRDFEKSYTSTNDLSGLTLGEFYIVKQDSSNDNSIVLATASTDAILGILQNKPKAGEPAVVRHGGTSKVVAGGTISRGAYVTTNSSSQAVATTTAGDHVIGIALDSAVSGDIFEILLVNFLHN